jgi:hypothetical protein
MGPLACDNTAPGPVAAAATGRAGVGMVARRESTSDGIVSEKTRERHICDFTITRLDDFLGNPPPATVVVWNLVCNQPHHTPLVLSSDNARAIRRASRVTTKGRTMLSEVVCDDPRAIARRFAPALSASCLLLLTATSLQAQAPTTPTVSVGAGVRTSFVHTTPEAGDSTDAFALDSVRLYVNGTAAPKVKFMFNTEYDGGNHIDVMDAAAQFEISPQFNIWAGRFLAPSDRANLYGPYYSHAWAVYTDGVQDGYPGIFQGRYNGAMYWGQFGKAKLSGGVFDGMTATGTKTPIEAGRVQVDFWDAEDGYYLNGTYYGGKNLLAIGVAGQVQGSDNHASSVDFLLERKVHGGGSFSIESEFAKYDKLGGYNSRYATDTGGYVLASYLFPTVVGMGKFEVLGKFAKANFTNGLNVIDRDYDQKTSELNLNYLIKEFNARVMIFYKDTRFNAVQSNFKQFGVGLQLQM